MPLSPSSEDRGLIVLVQERRCIIHSDNWVYHFWTYFILLCTVYSFCFTPLEFSFFRGLPRNLVFLDIASQIAFLADIVIQSHVNYRDFHTYRMIYNRTSISIPYFMYGFILDTVSCLPWDLIYKLCERKEGVRYLLWIRLCRVRKVTGFFQKMEKDICIHYLFTRIVKLIVLELYCIYTAACIFYYLVTTLPQSKEGYTWIESLKLGDYNYQNFWEIDFWKRYLTSLYFTILTMTIVGYRNIHAINIRELVVIVNYFYFGMILPICLLGNMIAHIVIWKRESFTLKIKELIKYMNRNRLEKSIHEQIEGHVRLQYDNSYAEPSVLQNLPISSNAKSGAKNTLIKQFKSDSILHIRRQESELAFKVNSATFHGDLHHLRRLINEGANLKKTDCDGHTPLHIAASRGHKDIVVFLIQEGVTINAIDKYGNTPLLAAIKCEHDSVVSLLFNEGAKLGLNDAGSQLCEAVSREDLGFLKRVLSCGADPDSRNCDNRTPLHIAACKGLFLITEVLLEARANVFIKDRWGTSPLVEASKRGSSSFLKLFTKAVSEELLNFLDRSHEVVDKSHKTQRGKCTVFPFDPLCPRDKRREGIVMWIPQTMEELIKSAKQQLKCSGTCILSEQRGMIFDVDLISDGQRLYMPADSELTNAN